MFRDRGLAGASHHGIIPNVNTADSLREIWPRLSTDERRMFDVIARFYLAAVMPDFRYRETTVTLDVGGHVFRATGGSRSNSVGAPPPRTGSPRRSAGRMRCPHRMHPQYRHSMESNSLRVGKAIFRTAG